MTHDVWETSSLASMRAELHRRAVEELRTLLAASGNPGGRRQDDKGKPTVVWE